MPKNDNKQRKDRLLPILIILVFVIGLIVFLVHSANQRKMAEKQEIYEQMLQEAVAKMDDEILGNEVPIEVPASTEEISEESKETSEVIQTEILPQEPLMDFAYLKEQNSDIIAWVSIEDTSVEYPVLQSEDNDYYISHNIDGSKGYPGCIYAESYNKKNFTDPLTVIYGHNMKNGTMFGGLKDFQEENYFKEHKELVIHLPNENLHYELIAASLFSDRHLLQDDLSEENGQYKFEGMKGNEAVNFIQLLRDYGDKKGIFTENSEIDETDKILVLSTCCGNPNKRLLIVYKLTTSIR